MSLNGVESEDPLRAMQQSVKLNIKMFSFPFLELLSNLTQSRLFQENATFFTFTFVELEFSITYLKFTKI